MTGGHQRHSTSSGTNRRTTVTRRRLLAGTTALATAAAGCSSSGEDFPDQPTGNSYGDLRQTLELTRQPWQKDPNQIASQMSEEMAVQVGHLSKAAIRGKSLGALKSIGEAVVTSFKLLEKGEASFNREIMRTADDVAVQTHPEIEGHYGDIGAGYNTERPYLPLYNTIIRDLEELEAGETGDRLSRLRSDAEIENTILTLMWPSINSKAKGGNDPLLNCLQYLRRSVSILKDVQG